MKVARTRCIVCGRRVSKGMLGVRPHYFPGRASYCDGENLGQFRERGPSLIEYENGAKIAITVAIVRAWVTA